MLSVINQVTAQENDAMQEVSTGKKLNVPADDPAGMALLVQNKAQQADCDQYTQNIATLQSSMQTADSALNNVITQLNRAVTLGVEGANGTFSDADRNAIAAEVSDIKSQVLSLANTTFNGSYLFGGTATNQKPFVVDASAVSGVTYAGNSNTYHVPIGEGLDVAANVPGDSLFLSSNDVFSALQGLISSLQSGSGIDTATGAVRDAFNHVSAVRVTYGTTMSQLQQQGSFVSNTKLQFQNQENSLSSVDMAEAISRLTNAENARNAALAAAGQIGRTSLLDYLGTNF